MMELKVSSGLAVPLTDETGIGGDREGGFWVGGFASTFGNVDLGNDIVQRGAFKDSLARAPSVPVLWSHDLKQVPLGKTSLLAENQDGLLFRCRILPTSLGEDVRTAIEGNALSGVSIGYNVVKSHSLGNGVRSLDSVDLGEISLCTLPMNPKAQIFTVGKETIVDALLCAMVEDDLKNHIPLPVWKVKSYIAAQERALERIQFGGYTRKEMLNQVLYELQELEKDRQLYLKSW